MKCKCKMAVAFLLVLVMLVPLSLSCGGGGGGGGKVTIHIGQLTDFTGVASPALKQITYITEDMIRYYNDEELIPGVKLKLDAYDTKIDPSRYSLGYEWCKQKGDDVIITIVADAPMMLKPFAERDKVVLAAMGGIQELFSPPGWVFGFSNTVTSSSITLLHWILENDWEGDGIPKIGMINTDDAQPTESAKEIKAYLNKHPNEYEYVGGLTVPLSTMTVTSEAKSLKDKGCDYIVVTTPSIFGPLLRDLREFGSEAKLLDCSGGMSSFAKVLVQLVGWDMLDGCYSTAQSYTWSDSDPIVDLARTLTNRYHSAGEAQDLLSVDGCGYVGPAYQLVPILEVLQQTVKNVGAENFNGKAYYDAAIDYKTTSSMWSGCPEFSFSETRRKLMDYTLITGFKGGDVKDYVTISGWLPDIVE